MAHEPDRDELDRDNPLSDDATRSLGEDEFEETDDLEDEDEAEGEDEEEER